MARTGLRFIIEQHIAGKEEMRRDGFSGVIQEKCFPADVIHAAATEAKEICDRCLGDAPEITVNGDVDLSFTYVPHHLHYMMVELLKNSVRATVEHQRQKSADADGAYREFDEDFLPPVDVIIARGIADITIKVSDRGGGIPFNEIDNVWDFMYSTARAPDDFDYVTHEPGQAPVLAGYGVGLPLSRIYAKYFGGGLSIMSMEGWGTDAYCHLSRLGDRCEALPRSVARSPAERDSNYRASK